MVAGAAATGARRPHRADSRGGPGRLTGAWSVTAPRNGRAGCVAVRRDVRLSAPAWPPLAAVTGATRPTVVG